LAPRDNEIRRREGARKTPGGAKAAMQAKTFRRFFVFEPRCVVMKEDREPFSSLFA
jgi:hypothetical protein